jgi:hypothetical protein
VQQVKTGIEKETYNIGEKKDGKQLVAFLKVNWAAIVFEETMQWTLVAYQYTHEVFANMLKRAFGRRIKVPCKGLQGYNFKDLC